MCLFQLGNHPKFLSDWHHEGHRNFVETLCNLHIQKLKNKTSSLFSAHEKSTVETFHYFWQSTFLISLFLPLLHLWYLHFLTAEAFLFPEDLVGVEDSSSDSSPPVAMLFRLKIQRWLCSGSLKLGTAARAAVRAMPRVQHRGIHKMCIRPNQERAFQTLYHSEGFGFWQGGVGLLVSRVKDGAETRAVCGVYIVSLCVCG